MRWDHERERCITGPPNPTADPERQTQVSARGGTGRERRNVESNSDQLALAVLCNPITDVRKTFQMIVLSHILLNGPNAPFHQALLQTNIGQVRTRRHWALDDLA